MTQNTHPARHTRVKTALLACSLSLVASLQAMAAPKDTATFIPIGFLGGDDNSLVYAVDDAVTLAGCYSYHRDPNNFTRIFSYAARWTLGDGLQPLPRLPNTPNGDTSLLSFAGARDVTADGSRVAFTAPTLDLTARASAISDPDGSNLIELTSLPNGDKMQVVSQLSDDGLTAFGYRLVDLYREGSIWTASGGVQALTPVAGYTNIAATNRAISSDGTVSAGDLFSVDPEGFFISAEQAYRWTSTGGVEPIPFFPDDGRSDALALTPDGSKLLGGGSQVFDSTIYFHRFFLWTEGGTMTDLEMPRYDSSGNAFSGGSGIASEGDLFLVSTGGYSFIRRLDYPFYFKFEDILAQAGLGSAIDGWHNFSVTGITDDGNTVFGQATNPEAKGEGFIVKFPPDFLRSLVAPVPEITSSLSAEATLGEPFQYFITASGTPDSFDATGLPAGLTVQTGSGLDGTLLFGFIQGTPTEIGEFQVTLGATNVAGTGSATLTLTVQDSPLVPKLLNISTRAQILTNDKVLIGGFIITGNQLKKVLLRAVGPSLIPFGITDALADPVLELHNSFDGSVVTNDNWKDSQEAEIEATGLAPNDELESALIATLVPGSYTAIVSGKDGGIGVGLVEAYDLDNAAQSKLANISTRGFVDTEDNVLIGGVIVGSVGGKVVVRAIGPSLEAFGITGALLDPVLELHNADGSTLASNDDWRETQEAEIEASGFAPNDDRESTIIATLPASSYTAIVRGQAATSGIGLVEAYNVD